MTTLQHFCELLTSFLIKVTYLFVLLKIAHFYFSISQINYSLKHVEQKRWRAHSLTLHFRGLLILYPVGNSLLIKPNPQHDNSTLWARLEGCNVYGTLENPFNQNQNSEPVFSHDGLVKEVDWQI